MLLPVINSINSTTRCNFWLVPSRLLRRQLAELDKVILYCADTDAPRLLLLKLLWIDKILTRSSGYWFYWLWIAPAIGLVLVQMDFKTFEHRISSNNQFIDPSTSTIVVHSRHSLLPLLSNNSSTRWFGVSEILVQSVDIQEIFYIDWHNNCIVSTICT